MHEISQSQTLMYNFSSLLCRADVRKRIFERNEMLISRITTALVLSILLLVIGMQAHQPSQRVWRGLRQDLLIRSLCLTPTGRQQAVLGISRQAFCVGWQQQTSHSHKPISHKPSMKIKIFKSACDGPAVVHVPTEFLCGRRRTAPFDSSTQIAASMRLKNVEHRAARSSSHLHPILQS